MQDENTNNNFVGVFPSNYMNKFIVQKKGKCPFIITNTNNYSKGGTHWWSILNIEPKTDIFFFDSFGLGGLRHFIIQDDKKVIEKFLFGTEKSTRTDNKITLANIRFNLNACKNLSNRELDALSDTATNFFHFIQAFSSKLKLHNFVNIWVVEYRVQDLNSVTCGIFQLCFYDNLFNPEENSKIQNKTRFNKRKIETLLNEHFVLDDQETNEETIKQYPITNNITLK